MSCLNIFTDDIRVDINHVDRSGRSALLLAAEEGMEKVVKALLSAKRMDFHSTDKGREECIILRGSKRSTPNCKIPGAIELVNRATRQEWPERHIVGVKQCKINREKPRRR